MADHSERIAEIEAILRTGVREHSVDGQRVVYDLDSLRRELTDLRRADAAAASRRPRLASIDLSGA